MPLNWSYLSGPNGQILSQNSYHALTHCGAIRIDVSSGGTPSSVPRGWYQLLSDNVDVGGRNYLSEGSHTLRINQFASDFLATPHQGYINGASQIPEAVGGFSIQFGEQVIPIDDCDNFVDNALDKADYYFVNILQEVGAQFDLSFPRLLTARRGHHEVYRNMQNVVTVWGGETGVTLRIDPRSDAVLGADYNVPPGTVTVIPYTRIMPSGYTYDVYLVDAYAFNDDRFSVTIREACPDVELYDVHFLEQIGGWSNITFRGYKSQSVSRRTSRKCYADFCRTNHKRNELSDAGSTLKWVLEVNGHVDQIDATIYEAFSIAREHRIYVNRKWQEVGIFLPIRLLDAEYEHYNYENTTKLEYVFESMMQQTK